MNCEYCPAVLVSVLALYLADGKSTDEINLLSAMFVQLGDTLETIAASKSNSITDLCKSQQESEDS